MRETVYEAFLFAKITPKTGKSNYNRGAEELVFQEGEKNERIIKD